MIDVWWMVNARSKYVSWGHLLITYAGFIVICGIIGLCVYLAQMN